MVFGLFSRAAVAREYDDYVFCGKQCGFKIHGGVKIFSNDPLTEINDYTMISPYIKIPYVFE